MPVFPNLKQFRGPPIPPGTPLEHNQRPELCSVNSVTLSVGSGAASNRSSFKRQTAVERSRPPQIQVNTSFNLSADHANLPGSRSLSVSPGGDLCPFDYVENQSKRGRTFDFERKKTIWERGKLYVYNKVVRPGEYSPGKLVDVDPVEVKVNDKGYQFSMAQIAEFRKVFNTFDTDGNNTIGIEELGCVLEALGYSPVQSDIQKVMSRFDTDKSGDLTFEEYLELMAVWIEEDETQIVEAFKVFDRSGDGFVTIAELKKALCKFGEKFTETEADEFFDLIDANKDGIINYEEFTRYMLSELNRGPSSHKKGR